MKKEYICVAPDKEVFSVSGKSLGMQGERALYYSAEIGEDRVYRQSYPLDIESILFDDFVLFQFDKKEEAQELCDEINDAYHDDFKVMGVK